jgi:F-type H+-transporting ATPase subunit delta
MIATRYAKALMSSAADAGAVDPVEKNMEEMSAMLAGSADLQRLISSPSFTRSQLSAAISAISTAARFQDVTVRFLGVLANARRLSYLPQIIAEFRLMASIRRGEKVAKVVSAFPLTPAQETLLRETLEKNLGGKVKLETRVDPSLLGGMTVTVGSKMIDDSLKGKLDRLKQVLQTQSNQNVKLKEVG